jgi:hypothetical protein
MTHVEMIATGKFCYGGSNLKPGDVFWAETAHAKLLKIVRNAKEVISPIVTKKHIAAEYPAALVAATVAPKKRPYRRRDMHAE